MNCSLERNTAVTHINYVRFLFHTCKGTLTLKFTIVNVAIVSEERCVGLVPFYWCITLVILFISSNISCSLSSPVWILSTEAALRDTNRITQSQTRRYGKNQCTIFRCATPWYYGPCRDAVLIPLACCARRKAAPQGACPSLPRPLL